MHLAFCSSSRIISGVAAPAATASPQTAVASSSAKATAAKRKRCDRSRIHAHTSYKTELDNAKWPSVRRHKSEGSPRGDRTSCEFAHARDRTPSPHHISGRAAFSRTRIAAKYHASCTAFTALCKVGGSHRPRLCHTLTVGGHRGRACGPHPGPDRGIQEGVQCVAIRAAMCFRYRCIQRGHALPHPRFPGCMLLTWTQFARRMNTR